MFKLSKICFAFLFLFAAPNALTLENNAVSTRDLSQKETASSNSEMKIGLAPGGQKRLDKSRLGKSIDTFRKVVDGSKKEIEHWTQMPLEKKVQVLYAASQSGTPRLRENAVSQLAEFDPAYLPEKPLKVVRTSLMQSVISENENEIRKKAFDGWMSHVAVDGVRAMKEMEAGLDHQNPMLAGRALHAMQKAGGKKALRPIMKRVIARWGRGQRSHILVAQQRAYISDYDISGAVFDPVVRSFLTGVVMDTRTLEIEMSLWVMRHLREMGAPMATVKNPKRWDDFVDRFERIAAEKAAQDVAGAAEQTKKE